MHRHSRPAPANRRLTNYATNRGRARLRLPILKSGLQAFVSPPKISFAVPMHPNENADQEYEYQIKRDFLFGVSSLRPNHDHAEFRPNKEATLCQGHRAGHVGLTKRNVA